MLTLTGAELERALEPGALVGRLAEAFAAHARGDTQVPQRTAVAVGDRGVLFTMPASSRGAAGAKLVAVHPGNRALGLPTLHALYVLLDGLTGVPAALLEGRVLTALRTGATSALAARHLARPASRHLLLFGAGWQAGFQARCLAAVLSLERITVAGRDPGRTRAFADALGPRLGLPVEVAEDSRAAVGEADVVSAATTSRVPVLFGRDVRPGTHVDLVGAFRPDDREADTECVRRARVVVDTRAGAFEEAGDILLAMREGAIDRHHVTAELAELVTGARPGRCDDREVTLFKSVGCALEDLAAAGLALERARALGLGTEIGL